MRRKVIHNAKIMSLSRLIGRDVDSSMGGFMWSSGAKEVVGSVGETLVTISGISGRSQRPTALSLARCGAEIRW